MRIVIFLLLLTALGCSQNNKGQGTDTRVKFKGGTSTFEFGGNYLPSEEIVVKEYLLNSIEIDTHDTLQGYFIKKVYLRFLNMKSEDDEYYVIKNTSIQNNSKDDFWIIANDSLLGNIEIKGRFLGEKGPRLNNIKGSKEIVFEGVLFVDGKKETKITCNYFEGD